MRKKRHTYRYKPYAGRRQKWWAAALAVCLAVGLAVFAALQIYIQLRSRTDVQGEPDVMVIFGCQVRESGPSLMLLERLDAALDYLEVHPETAVVVSGGQGRDEPETEAQAMYEYLTRHGVDSARIHLEDRSRNTWQNVRRTMDLLQKDLGLDPEEDRAVLAVSSGFHLARIEMLWQRGQGGELNTLAAPVGDVFSAVRHFFREPLALVKSFLFDR